MSEDDQVLIFNKSLLDLEGVEEHTLSVDSIPGDISFYVDNDVEALKICANGDFIVHGKKVTNDEEVYRAFVEFLKESGTYR